ncbi:Rho termination protein [Moorena producens PAL-8-15-08-1]|uniref:Rho termination protein n=1 Tax=Moorena producens PAL-8-15-08-1 TaxID=1458985 RepID=A0A1D8TU75_9CYAN|nr:DUF4912 domain-containing protein [Moorena producens]AOX01167.1 Rho termination protein [Moorena producens PAL-8-15-08-1]
MAKEGTPLEEMTLRQLRRVASEYSISRYSRMRKARLLAEIQAIERHKRSTTPSPIIEAQAKDESSQFELAQEEPTSDSLVSVDEGLAELPEGYGESRIVLMPRDPHWSYAYWDIPNEHKKELRSQGGQQLALRLYDVTAIKLDDQSPHSIQEYPCDELAREWYLPMPVSDRDYVVEIGYRCEDGQWLVLARSAPIHAPPAYPSKWMEDQFITVNWNDNLQGKTVLKLLPPSQTANGSSSEMPNPPIYGEIFGITPSGESQAVAGSVYSSMQQVPRSAITSNAFPSGIGKWVSPNMSGAGLRDSAPPAPSPELLLVADADLVIHGTTDPDASVTIDGLPVKINPDGTFRFQMSLQDALIDYPIMAVSANGKQTCSIHMKFIRETPSSHTDMVFN